VESTSTIPAVQITTTMIGQMATYDAALIFETNKGRKFGGVVHESREDFFREGGKCQSPQRTPEEEARVNDDFKSWKEKKDNPKMGGLNAELERRQLWVATIAFIGPSKS
jgi:hypothetical protein